MSKHGYFIVKEGLSYLHEVTYASELITAKKELLWQINNDSDDYHTWSVREVEEQRPLDQLEVICTAKKPRNHGILIPMTEDMLIFAEDIRKGYRLRKGGEDDE